MTTCHRFLPLRWSCFLARLGTQRFHIFNFRKKHATTLHQILSGAGRFTSWNHSKDSGFRRRRQGHTSTRFVQSNQRSQIFKMQRSTLFRKAFDQPKSFIRWYLVVIGFSNRITKFANQRIIVQSTIAVLTDEKHVKNYSFSISHCAFSCLRSFVMSFPLQYTVFQILRYN